jgi:hypothetical protein
MDAALQRVLLRVFFLVWGIADPPKAEDFAELGRRLQTEPRTAHVGAEILPEIREVLELDLMSAALSRVERRLARIVLPLPEPHGEAIKANVCGIRRLIHRVGVRSKTAPLGEVCCAPSPS